MATITISIAASLMIVTILRVERATTRLEGLVWTKSVGSRVQDAGTLRGYGAGCLKRRVLPPKPATTEETRSESGTSAATIDLL